MIVQELSAQGATGITFTKRPSGKTEARFTLPGIGQRFLTYSVHSHDHHSFLNKRCDIRRLVRGLKANPGRAP